MKDQFLGPARIHPTQRVVQYEGECIAIVEARPEWGPKEDIMHVFCPFCGGEHRHGWGKDTVSGTIEWGSSGCPSEYESKGGGIYFLTDSIDKARSRYAHPPTVAMEFWQKTEGIPR